MKKNEAPMLQRCFLLTFAAQWRVKRLRHNTIGMIQKVAIIGVGLIGGSIGLALKKHRTDLEIIGHDRPEVLEQALKRNAIDQAGLTIQEAIQEADLGIDYITRRNGLIEAVTQDDIKRVAERLLGSENLIVTVVGQPEGLEAN